MNKEEIKNFEIIKSQSPLTKYFDLMKTEEIKPSYKWYSTTPGSQVYFPYIWNYFFQELLNKNNTAATMENHWMSNLNLYLSLSSNTGNKGWFGSTLARLFYIPDGQFNSSISSK